MHPDASGLCVSPTMYWDEQINKLLIIIVLHCFDALIQQQEEHPAYVNFLSNQIPKVPPLVTSGRLLA